MRTVAATLQPGTGALQDIRVARNRRESFERMSMILFVLGSVPKVTAKGKIFFLNGLWK
jgi:hypothetical protein